MVTVLPAAAADPLAEFQSRGVYFFHASFSPLSPFFSGNYPTNIIISRGKATERAFNDGVENVFRLEKGEKEGITGLIFAC